MARSVSRWTRCKKEFHAWVPVMELLVLAYTACWIVKYTKETQLLRQEAIEQRIDGERPLVTFTLAAPYQLTSENIRKGPALDVEFRLSQVHPNGHLTNLSYLISNDAERHILNLGENEHAGLGGSENVRAYAFAESPAMRWGTRDVFAAIATYEDVNRRP